MAGTDLDPVQTDRSRAGASAGPAPPIDSVALLQGRSEVVIRHGGREYRLRRTRLDKLILTA